MCLFTFETFLNIVGHILLVQKQDLYLTSYSEYEICNIFFPLVKKIFIIPLRALELPHALQKATTIVCLGSE